MLFNGNYWLASRCIHPISGCAYFDVRRVDGDNARVLELCYGNVYNLFNNTYSSNYAVRPVVILKSNVIDIDENYDSENGWKLK